MNYVRLKFLQMIYTTLSKLQKKMYSDKTLEYHCYMVNVY